MGGIIADAEQDRTVLKYKKYKTMVNCDKLGKDAQHDAELSSRIRHCNLPLKFGTKRPS